MNRGMLEQAGLMLALAVATTLLLVDRAWADGPMGVTLPDWSSAIGSQVNTFMAWGAIAGPTQFVISIAVGAIAISLFLSVFLRGR